MPEGGAASLIRNALAQGFATWMRVDVDHAWKKKPLGAVDHCIGRFGTVSAHERNLAAAHQEIEIAAVDMPALRLVPRHGPSGIAEQCGVCHRGPCLKPSRRRH